MTGSIVQIILKGSMRREMRWFGPSLPLSSTLSVLREEESGLRPHTSSHHF